MTQPTRIQARALDGDRASVRMLMSHEMETGFRKDGDGRIVPAWFIQEVEIMLNGRPVLTAQWGTGVAKNPSLQFVLRDARRGDSVRVAWLDNRGERRSDEVTVT